MSTVITENILLKAGFIKGESTLFKYENDTILIFIEENTFPLTTDWRCHVNNWNVNSDTDIQAIDHFNKLMELMDIDFKINEE